MAQTAWVAMTRATAGRQSSKTARTRVDAGVKELNEMTIGRTDDPENPFVAQAFKAASVFGLGSRTPSGPAAVLPRQQAEHMIAIDPPVRILIFSLASEGPSTHATWSRRGPKSDACGRSPRFRSLPRRYRIAVRGWGHLALRPRCAPTPVIAPSTIGGHAKRPFSSRLANRQRPLPSQYSAFR